MEWIYLILSFIGGVGLAFQSSVNAELGKKMGTLEVALIAYIVGTLVLFVMTMCFGKGDFTAGLTFPKWKLFVGVMGALFIFIMVSSIPKIGVAPAVSAAIVGQMILGTVMDHFGLFGSPTIPINPYRIAGLVFMFLSMFLFYKR